MTILQDILAAFGWQTRVTENFRSVAPAGLYGIDPSSTTGLTLGYLGGEFNGVTVANGTVVLTASNTNYVVAHRTTGAVTAAITTTNWLDTTTYMQLYQLVAGASTFTIAAASDKRQAFGAAGSGTGDVVGPASAVSGRVATFDGTSGKLIQDGGTLLSDLAPKASPALTGTATAVNVTLSGLALTAASTTGGAGLRIPPGAAPTSPVDGDMWTTTTGAFARINGVTVGPFASASGSATWGSITGTLSSQTDLQAALDLKQNRSPNVQSVASSPTVTPTFSNDAVKITAQAAGLTLANPTGTAIDMAGLVIRIKDNGTARSISYDTQYRAIGVTLPTTTVISKTLYLACIWNSDDTKLDVVAVGQEA